jgi:predicted Zn-dependent protease
MRLPRIHIAVAALFLALSACVTTGPQITSEEERRAKEALLAESKTWQRKQQERIDEIAARLLAAAGTQSVLRFIFINTFEQTGERINPEAVQAWTDGEGVWITRGMVRFIRSDDELASVLSHEIAHALRGHLRYLLAQEVIGRAIAIPASRFGGRASGEVANWLVRLANAKFDRDKEREADLYGLIWLHRAGFNVDVGKEIFKRMAIEMPEALDRGFMSRHPSLPERFLSLDKIAAALKAGQDPLKLFGADEAKQDGKGKEEKKSEGQSAEKAGGY